MGQADDSVGLLAELLTGLVAGLLAGLLAGHRSPIAPLSGRRGRAAPQPLHSYQLFPTPQSTTMGTLRDIASSISFTTISRRVSR